MSGHKPFQNLKDKMSDESKARAAKLTRDADETIRARAARDPEFRDALIESADQYDASGDTETAQGLRSYLPQEETKVTDKSTLLPRLNELVAEVNDALEEVDMFDLDSADPASNARFDELERRYFTEASTLVGFVSANREELADLLGAKL